MKNLTAILCAALIGGAIIYHAHTRPGRYQYPKSDTQVVVFDTATGIVYIMAGAERLRVNPVKETFEWPWE